jgi:plastocyanin
MKIIFPTLFLLLLTGATATGTIHTITNAGFTFSPSSINVAEGDTVMFSLASIHTAREVSQSTWNANGTTPLGGGFDLPSGGGMVVMSGAGVHYYVCVPHGPSGMKGTITVNTVTGVRAEDDPLPGSFFLENNYPNPFNPSTKLSFSVGTASFTEIVVYSTDGRKVKTLSSGTLAPGTYSLSWDGTDDRGLDVVSDVYFVRMLSGPAGLYFSATRKMLLLR